MTFFLLTYSYSYNYISIQMYESLKIIQLSRSIYGALCLVGRGLNRLAVPLVMLTTGQFL